MLRKSPDITPNVREPLICPCCGRKTLYYAPAGLNECFLDYRCVSPTCHYTHRKFCGSMLPLLLSGTAVYVVMLITLFSSLGTLLSQF